MQALKELSPSFKEGVQNVQEKGWGKKKKANKTKTQVCQM